MISVMLTPLEATQRCQTQGPFIHDGVSYFLDGSKSVLATHIESGIDFVLTDEGGETDWLPMGF